MTVTHWVRFERDGGTSGFGVLADETIRVHTGDLFAGAHPSDESVAVKAVRLLTPCSPGKIIGLWNNSRALAEKQGLSEPAEPLFFLKPPSACLADGEAILKPASHDGSILFEAELGIVIGHTCTQVDEAEAEACIFGYTCVNDVTAVKILTEDESFPQWTRAKGFDTFAPIGPCIAAGLHVANAHIRSELNGRLRKDYPVSDLLKQPAALVSALSHCMTLEPGDVIACGTGPGSLPMRPGATIAVEIDGIGRLSNRFMAEASA